MDPSKPHVKVWGVTLDPTVNVGHIMTAMVFLATAIAGWAQLDSRQNRLEERTARLERLQEVEARDALSEAQLIARMSAQLDGVQSSIRRIENLLDRQVPGPGRPPSP